MAYNLSEIDSDYLSEDWLYRKIDELVIFRYYCGEFQLGTNIKSPLRKGDNDPSFNISWASNWGRMRYKDFGTGESGSAVRLVSRMFGLSFRESIIKIATDFGLIDNLKPVVPKPLIDEWSKEAVKKAVNTLIQIKSRSYFTKEELDYWYQYLITEEELKQEKVFPIDKLWINKQLITMPNKFWLRFAYYYPEYNHKLKIYTPGVTNFKWITNLPTTAIDGLQDLPKKSDLLLITKSKKDKMVIKKIHPDTCSTQNENALSILPEHDEHFKNNYKHRIIVWDSDETGKRECMKLNERGYGWLNVPNKFLDEGIKDFSDLVFHYKEEGLNILREELDKKWKLTQN